MAHPVHVLIIEDDVPIARMYQMGLQRHGFTVTTAHDGRAGLEAALADPPDVICLDLGLPQMHGLAVLEHLKADARTASVPVLVITNFDDSTLLSRGRALGALNCVLKARVTPSRLSAIVRQMTGRLPPAKAS